MSKSQRYALRRPALPALRFYREGSPPASTPLAEPETSSLGEKKNTNKSLYLQVQRDALSRLSWEHVWLSPGSAWIFPLITVMTGIFSGSVQHSLPLLLFIPPREYSLEIIKLPFIPKVCMTGILSPTSSACGVCVSI